MQISPGGHLEKQNGRQKCPKTGLARMIFLSLIIKVFYQVIALWTRIEEFYALIESFFSIFSFEAKYMNFSEIYRKQAHFLRNIENLHNQENKKWKKALY